MQMRNKNGNLDTKYAPPKNNESKSAAHTKEYYSNIYYNQMVDEELIRLLPSFNELKARETILLNTIADMSTMMDKDIAKFESDLKFVKSAERKKDIAHDLEKLKEYKHNFMEDMNTGLRSITMLYEIIDNIRSESDVYKGVANILQHDPYHFIRFKMPTKRAINNGLISTLINMNAKLFNSTDQIKEKLPETIKKWEFQVWISRLAFNMHHTPYKIIRAKQEAIANNPQHESDKHGIAALETKTTAKEPFPAFLNTAMGANSKNHELACLFKLNNGAYLLLSNPKNKDNDRYIVEIAEPNTKTWKHLPLDPEYLEFNPYGGRGESTVMLDEKCGYDIFYMPSDCKHCDPETRMQLFKNVNNYPSIEEADESVDISVAEMAASAFGKGSNVSALRKLNAEDSVLYVAYSYPKEQLKALQDSKKENSASAVGIFASKSQNSDEKVLADEKVPTIKLRA